MSVAQMRTDLAARAAVNTALNCYEQPPDMIETPAFVVGPLDTITYHTEGMGTFGKPVTRFTFLCRVYVGRVDMEEAVIALDPYLDPRDTGSIPYLLDDKQGASVSDTAGTDWTNVREARDVGAYDFGGVEYIGAELVVEMYV